MADPRELAINGGPKAMRARYAMRSVQLRKGLTRSLDLMKALPLTLRGITTITDGSGKVGAFQRDFARLAGTEYALAMNSGTAALHSAYFALGVGPGTEVIVPAYTWNASATPVLQCGAVPVFCEVDPKTLTVDPDDLERRITDRTRAICVVHIWGNPAEMDRIVEIAERRGVGIVEDCSHAHGASYKGRPVGSWGDVGCFSLQGSKSVDGGEAGVAVTSDAVLYDRMLLLGHCHMVPKGQKADTFPDIGDMSLGVKYRPHLLGVLLAHADLQRLSARNRRGARIWRVLCDELAGTPGIRPVDTLPGAERGGWYAFVFAYEGKELGGPDTEEFVERVRAEGVPMTLDQFRGKLLHEAPLFTSLDRRTLGGGCFDHTRPWEENLCAQELPVSEDVAARHVRLPPQLSALRESYARACAVAIRKVLAASLPGASAG